MKTRGFFVAATGQNVGKTTICLGVIAGLLKRYAEVGYFKPIGQEHVETETGAIVDKDVVLFRSYFNMQSAYEKMSPVLFPRGFTRDYLDEKVSRQELIEKIKGAYDSLSSNCPITVIEGTGHMGVGSIIDLNNAQVAAHLEAPLLLIASGGLGSSFDELELNRTQCEKHGVRVAGVILNRVLDDKRAMIEEYMGKALKRWNIPLLGCIPYTPFLSIPTLSDFEQLFQTELLTGHPFRWRHFQEIRLIASATEMDPGVLGPKQLLITPAGREDIILAVLTRLAHLKIAGPNQDPEIGMILTGKKPPKESIVEQIERAEIPMLYTPVSSFIAMKMINSYTAKIRREDNTKIEKAVHTVESHIDFDRLQAALQM
jgi:BioD-like phosphotransacetylase family protein